MTASVRRALRAFGAFWLDFLVGDTPELFVATLVVVAAAIALGHHGAWPEVVVPLIAVAALLASAARGARGRPKG